MPADPTQLAEISRRANEILAEMEAEVRADERRKTAEWLRSDPLPSSTARPHLLALADALERGDRG